ncbi:hypothetical protein F511_36761 [Dorcoceras hygrometricum]|uniref:COP1-interacting protein 7 n=1 Tax=Dorcoceras hygrometricum TaxID=472368 RepID=A0A2Z7CLA1_9LAMI|nr:hypothetical protein F511_36761 [Dorcoceras hygrometricum]
MEKLKAETPLDYAVFQLSPKRTRCELFVSSDGSTEKIASGLLKPFVAHLKFAEQQIASAARSVKLEVGRRKNTSWFTKGTLERFVRFVSTPEVLEFVNMCDAEMSQLEAAQRIYTQGTGNQLSGGGGSGVTAAEDATKYYLITLQFGGTIYLIQKMLWWKRVVNLSSCRLHKRELKLQFDRKELLRAIDVRLVAVQQDLSTACARAHAAGFNIDSVYELQMFADKFGARRLNEACCNFMAVCERRSDLTSLRKTESDDGAIRSSYGSDMSIDDDPPSPPPPVPYQCQQQSATCQQPSSSMITFPFSRKFSINRDNGDKPKDVVPLEEREEETSPLDLTQSVRSSQPSRKLSVQDRISMFETKEKDNSGEKSVVAKPVHLRRLSSDVPTSGAPVVEKAVLRRWSGASDMSIDLSTDRKDNESPLCTPLTAAVSQNKSSEKINDASTSSYVVPELNTISCLSQVDGCGLKNAPSSNIEASSGSIQSNSNKDSCERDGMKNQVPGRTPWSFTNKFGGGESWEQKLKTTPSIKKEDAMPFGDQMNSKGSQRSEELTGAQKQITVVKDQCSLTRVMPFRSKSGGTVEILDQRDDSESMDEAVAQRYANTGEKTSIESVMFESGFKFYEPSAARDKRNAGGSLFAQQDIRSTEETKVIKKKELRSSDMVANTSVSTVEDSGPQRSMFNRQGMASENIKKAQFQRNEGSSVGRNMKTPFSEKFVAEARDGIDSFSTPPTEQTRRARQSKGKNYERNDDLRMKANELEKIFAKHKLRTPGDQFISVRKVEPETNYMEPMAVFSPQMCGNHQLIDLSCSSKNMNHNYADNTSKDFSMLSISEGSRGKFYDSYMQKRNAKLREEWSSNRAEKEARLKSMQDSLERSRSEMKMKLSGSAGRRDPAFSGQPHADSLGSYNSRSILKKGQLDL